MKTFIAVIGIVVLSASSVLAEPYNTSASQKVLGHSYGGYRSYSARAYQSNARTHASALHEYTTVAGSIPKETADEHAAEVRRNLAMVDKELAKLEKAVKNDKVAVDLIAQILKHHANALESCGMVEEECAKAKPEGSEVASCCTTMTDELALATEAHTKLMHHLKIPVDSPKSKVTTTTTPKSPKAKK